MSDLHEKVEKRKVISLLVIVAIILVATFLQNDRPVNYGDRRGTQSVTEPQN